jgi:hypothetical protein
MQRPAPGMVRRMVRAQHANHLCKVPEVKMRLKRAVAFDRWLVGLTVSHNKGKGVRLMPKVNPTVTFPGPTCPAVGAPGKTGRKRKRSSANKGAGLTNTEPAGYVAK